MTIRYLEFEPQLELNQNTIADAHGGALKEGYIIPPGTIKKEITPSGSLDKQLITVYKSGNDSVGRLTVLPYRNSSASYEVSEGDVFLL